jgi:hypothetical protein
VTNVQNVNIRIQCRFRCSKACTHVFKRQRERLHSNARSSIPSRRMATCFLISTHRTTSSNSSSSDPTPTQPSSISSRATASHSADPRDSRASNDQRCHKRLLDVGEAEAVRDLGNGLAELVGELDILVVRQLALPKPAVGDALVQVRVREVVLAVEARGAFLAR